MLQKFRVSTPTWILSSSGVSGVIPDGHVGAGDGRQADGARETLVTLGVIVLEADLELDSLEEVALLGLVGVLKELSDLSPDVGCADGQYDAKIVIESS